MNKYVPFYGGAEFHDYHHYVGGQSHSNFASVFTYCDYIYRTDKGYRYHKKVLRNRKISVYFLIEDFMTYWIHRGLHSSTWLYNMFHKVHHEYEAPVAFSVLYNHWGDIFMLGFPSFVGPAIVPGHMLTLWLWFSVREMEAIGAHSGYDFPWDVNKLIRFYGGAEYHDYHHFVGGQTQNNFSSIFRYNDYIYGTNKVIIGTRK
ncbi:Methylsterol monooxygenase 1-1 [Linum perenne]